MKIDRQRSKLNWMCSLQRRRLQYASRFLKEHFVKNPPKEFIYELTGMLIEYSYRMPFVRDNDLMCVELVVTN